MFSFSIEKKFQNSLARTGKISTPHGDILTPAFVPVATRATVKTVTPDQLKELGAEATLGNTYHLYLRPGEQLIKDAGGLGKFMNWKGPTFTDSGGFQVFSLGAAYGKGISKFVITEDDTDIKNGNGKAPTVYDEDIATSHGKLAVIDEEGVTFTSHIDGTLHRFTAERSIEIQHALGADIIFAFDECTAPTEGYEYQKEAMERTHRWAERSLKAHRQNTSSKQALFGIVQGGRFSDLRAESATFLGNMNFDGYGIGGSFTKKDLEENLSVVNNILPEHKPRHLLGIGEPSDIFMGVEFGADTFDCVAPTRTARNGTIYTKYGTIGIKNEEFQRDFRPIEEDCGCYTCQNFSRAYVSYLQRIGEYLGAELGSIHNIYFIVNLVKKIRQSLLDGNFREYKDSFLKTYYQ